MRLTNSRQPPFVFLKLSATPRKFEGATPMSSAAWLAITIVIVTAAIKLVVDEKPHHRHLAGRVLGLVLQRVAILSQHRHLAGRVLGLVLQQVAILSFRVCRFVDARAVFFGALLHSQLPARDGRLAVRAAHAAALAAAFAFDMAAAASVRANEWLNVRADALLASFSVVRVARTGFGAADVRAAGAGDVVLVAARTDAEPTRRGLARAMSPVRGGVARRRLAFDTTAAPPARFYILRRRLDAAADAAAAVVVVGGGSLGRQQRDVTPRERAVGEAGGVQLGDAADDGAGERPHLRRQLGRPALPLSILE